MTDSAFDLSPVWLSLKVAGAALLLIVPLGTIAAWRLAFGRPFWGKGTLEILLVLPLVLPPTVVGYLLLLLLGHGTRFGQWLNETAGIHLLFTWQGAALAAAIMAFPLFIRTALASFRSIEPELLEAGRTLGASEAVLLVRVILPLAFRGVCAATALAYARALGEFGATLMIAGSIPGRTQTLPLALYAAVQGGKNKDALFETLLLTAIAFVVLGGLSLYEQNAARRRR